MKLDAEKLAESLMREEAFGPPVEHPPHMRNQNILIWEPRLSDGEIHYVRTRDRARWAGCADVERIAPKRGKRVVLIGESVARGFFYDPEYTPARILEGILPGMEVVDLAQNDLRLQPLMELTRAAVALQPDAMVVFAGNNWLPYSEFDPSWSLQLAEAFCAGGCEVVRQSLEDVLKQRVAKLFDALARLSRTFRFPVLFVLPEFNLVDWREGLTPDVSRVLLEQERDSGLGFPLPRSPRCFRVVQDAVRQQNAVPVVDLPCLFEKQFGTLPGRNLFLDYCHHTSRGMRWAMAFTAAALLPMMNAAAPSANVLYEASHCPSVHVEAQAYLLAGVHNRRWGQPHDWFFAEAIGLDGRLVEAVDAFQNDAGVSSSLTDRFWQLAQKGVLSERALRWLAAEANVKQELGIVRAFERISEFEMCLDRASQIVVRVPGARPHQRIEVEVDGRHCISLPATERWHAASIASGRSLRVYWPEPEWTVEEEQARMLQRVRESGKPDFRSVYGEIHTSRTVFR